MVFRKNNGLTMIELLIVTTIIALFILVAIFAYQLQLAKGRDARRKADLDKLQNVLEDYLNDKICYPEPEEIVTAEGYICGKPFAPYLSSLPCDPINNIYYNYFYSYDSTKTCKGWYKIYTKLENTKDPIIAKVGCGGSDECPSGGCGPSCNYNYWVSSPNMNQVAPIPLAEDWWPSIPGVSPPPGGTPTPPPGGTPTPSPIPGVSPSPTPTPTLVPCGDGGVQPNCWDVKNQKLYCNSNICSTCCPGAEYRCNLTATCCFYDLTCL